MPSNLRRSTLEQRKSKKKEEIALRTIKHNSKNKGVSLTDLAVKSRKIKDLIEKEECEFKEEIQRLFAVYNTIELPKEDIDPPPPSPAGSHESLAWESYEEVNSPVEGETADGAFGFSTPPALSRVRSTSVSVNRADYRFVILSL